MTKKAKHENYLNLTAQDDSKLQLLNQLAEEQLAKEKVVKKCEEALQKARNELKEVAEDRLPSLMDELRLRTFTTMSGATIEVSENIRTSLPPENKPRAFAWLEQEGLSALIEKTVKVAFGRNEDDKANALVSKLEEDGLVAAFDKSIAPATMAKVLKDRLAEGKKVPLDIFKVFRQRQAVLHREEADE